MCGTCGVHLAIVWYLSIFGYDDDWHSGSVNTTHTSGHHYGNWFDCGSIYCHFFHHDSPIILMGELVMVIDTINAYSVYVTIVWVME